MCACEAVCSGIGCGMNKDELRIRIIPEDGQILIETYTDGIVKCKEIQEDALLD